MSTSDDENRLWREDGWHWLVRYKGRTRRLSHWARILGVDVRRLRKELMRRGVCEAGMTPSLWVDTPNSEAYSGANYTRYEDDPICQALVNGRGPLNCTEIGVIFGMSHQRVKQIEQEAIKNLMKAIKRLKLQSLQDVLYDALQRTDLDDRLALISGSEAPKPPHRDWSNVDWKRPIADIAKEKSASDKATKCARARFMEQRRSA